MAYASHFEAALRRYRPLQFRAVFVAEAPPAFETGRFFYFPDVHRADTLFLEMMKVLYFGTNDRESDERNERIRVADIRRTKARWLKRFQDDGFYLIDASDQPMPEAASTVAKRRRLEATLPITRREVKALVGVTQTPVILIGVLTYTVCAEPLRNEGIRILNREPINHPARGGQVEFRRKLTLLLQQEGIVARDGA